MKAITRLKTSMKRKKQKKTSQDGKAKKHRSIVSKYSRNAKAWNLRQNRRLQQCTTTSIEVDNTRRTCLNCGEQYTGRICPQCGQSGSWSRYTWHQAILNFLDIWGLGNRPIFRTIAELFWRPGYMIRDYLEGHRQFYFPPFKLVAAFSPWGDYRAFRFERSQWVGRCEGFCRNSFCAFQSFKRVALDYHSHHLASVVLIP